MANTLIRDYKDLQRLPIPAASAIAAMSAAPPPPPEPIVAPVLPNAAGPIVTKTPDPMVQNTRNSILGHQDELQRLNDTGSGISQIKNPLLRGLARVGNVAESIIAPRAAAVTPGTEENHRRLVGQEQGYLGQELGNQKEEATTALLDAQPDLKRMEAENAILKTQNQAQHYSDMADLGHERNLTALRRIGYALDETDPSGNTLRPLRYEEMDPVHQGAVDLNHVNEELKKAQKDYAEARKNNLPVQAALAQQRIDGATAQRGIALQKMGLQRETLDFNEDKHYNPQPTATERRTGDFAQSALERVAKMRAVIQKRPDLFGPGAGRADALKVAIGNQDPDIQTYMSNAQYLSDHSAAVFGGRGAYITKALHGLTDPHFNTGALNAALDEAESAATGFVKAGKIHGKGEKSGYSDAPTNYKLTATGQGGHKIGSNDDGKTWFDVKTGKAIQ